MPLRPLGVGDVLDGAFTTIRQYWRTVLAIAAVVGVVVAVLGAVAPVALVTGGGASEVLAVVAAVLSVSFSVLGSFVIGGALAIVVAQGVLGRSVSLRQVWDRLRPRLLPLLGVSFAPVVAVLGLVLLAAALTVGAYAVGGGVAAVAVGALAGMAVLAGAFYVYVRWLLAGPVVVLEGAGVRAGLRRSGELVSDGFWRTFGIWLLGSIIANVVAGVLQFPFLLLGALAGGTAGATGADPFAGGVAAVSVQALGQVLATVVTLPFSAAVVALLYVDRRMRREGLDLTLREAAGRG